MGILGSLKNRILRRKEEDFSSLRSNVLNEPMPLDRQMQPGPEPEPWNEPMPAPWNEPAKPGWKEPLSLENDEREPVSFEDERSSREIIDRLSFIENQLSAIKSQTETINERLKNMDMKIDRRYR